MICQTPADNLSHIDVGDVELVMCPCKSAPSKLLAQGLFPCAPLKPHLVVCMSMLDFLDKLFVKIPTNVSAFSDALVAFHVMQGDVLETRVR